MGSFYQRGKNGDWVFQYYKDGKKTYITDLGIQGPLKVNKQKEIKSRLEQKYQYNKSKKMENCTANIHDIDNDIVNDSYYQRAISFEVLEHVKDEQLTLSNIYKSLNHDALFAISVPNKWWIFETHGAYLPLLSWNRVPFFSWLPKKIHSRFAKARIYTKKDICRLLKKQGFNILGAHYVTAPMDAIKWIWLKNILRKTIFRTDTTIIPILSTSIMVICKKE